MRLGEMVQGAIRGIRLSENQELTVSPRQRERRPLKITVKIMHKVVEQESLPPALSHPPFGVGGYRRFYTLNPRITPMRSHNFSPREVPFSQMDRPLKESELSGSLAREVGLLPARRLQPGASATIRRDPRHVAYVHPPLHREPPKPSERRPAPHRRSDGCGV